MTPEQSLEAAYKLLHDNGFENVTISGSGHFWLVKTEKGTSATSDEPDNFWLPHECAQALVDAHRGVAPAPEPEQIGAHETDSEPVPESGEASQQDEAIGVLSEDDGSSNSGLDGNLPEQQLADQRADSAGVEQSAQAEAIADVQEPVREEVGSPAEATPGPVDLGDEGAAGGDAGSAEDGAAGRRGPLLADDGPAFEGDSDILDAAYDELSDPGVIRYLTQEAAEPAALEGGDIEQLFLEDQSDAPDLGAEILETDTPTYSDPARFYGLDDLDRRRSLRIGDVSRYALAIRAPWTSVDDARLVELRNFAMGVAEGRWPNDAAMEAELGTLEATLGRNNAIDQALQAKVTFLNGASREEVEAFVVEENWP